MSTMSRSISAARVRRSLAVSGAPVGKILLGGVVVGGYVSFARRHPHRKGVRPVVASRVYSHGHRIEIEAATAAAMLGKLAPVVAHLMRAGRWPPLP